MGGQLDEHLLFWQHTISIILLLHSTYCLPFEMEIKYDDDYIWMLLCVLLYSEVLMSSIKYRQQKLKKATGSDMIGLQNKQVSQLLQHHH